MYNTYLPATDKAKIKTKEIIAKSQEYDRYIQTYASSYHQIKPSPNPPAQNHLDKLIFNDTVAILAYDALTATLITHPHIAAFERSLFYQLWNSL